MKYLVRAKLKDGQSEALQQAIDDESLGAGSVAGGEYLRNMSEARLCDDDTIRWVEVCYCQTPLEEERPYWEEFFELEKVQNAHARNNCRDENGTESWACSHCDCTAKLEARMQTWGTPFLQSLKEKPERSDQQ